MHGGLSTGPRTVEGRQRSLEALKRGRDARAARRRAEREQRERAELEQREWDPY